MPELTTQSQADINAAMSALEDACIELRNAAKHVMDVSTPIHQRVCLLMDAVSDAEAQLTEFTGRFEG